MYIILKYLLRTINEKKLRTFILILSIAISTALFFASGSLTNTIMDMEIQKLVQIFGNSDIIIKPDDKSPSQFFSTTKADSYENKLDYVIGTIEVNAQYNYKSNEIANLNLIGTSIDDLSMMNTIIFEQQNDLSNFYGQKIIISKNTAEKYELSLGNTISVTINDQIQMLNIHAIAYPVGVFRELGGNIIGVVPKDTLGNIYNARGRSNVVYVKVTDPNDKNEILSLISSKYKQQSVRETISDEEIQYQVADITSLFFLISIIVAIMSVFVTHSSFKVITAERISIIGTLRSLGATKKLSSMFLIMESFLYSAIGGILGCVLGIIILYATSWYVSPEWMCSGKVMVSFPPQNLVLSFMVAPIIAFVSCIMPIIRVSNISLKELILDIGSTEKKVKNSIIKLVLGIIFVALSIILPQFSKKYSGIFLGIISIFCVIYSIILLAPYFSKLFILIFSKIFGFIFGNEGTLAVKNLRDNKSIINNIVIIAISTSCLLMINTITYSVLEELYNYYTKEAQFTMNAIVTNANMDESFVRLVKTIPDVIDASGVYSSEDVEIKSTEAVIEVLEGVDTRSFLDYWNLELSDNKDKLMQELDEDRNIIIGMMLKEQLNAKIGDSVTLILPAGEVSYKIIGFTNTANENGKFGMISNKFYKLDTQTRFYNYIRVKSNGEVSKLQENFMKKFARLMPNTNSLINIANQDIESSKSEINFIRIFALISLLIGVLSITNNLVISFIQRKHSIAILLSIGMSKAQLKKMIFIESLSIGIIGGLIGIAGAVIMINIMPYIMTDLNTRIIIHYSVFWLILFFFGGTIITVVVSLGPTVKISKLNVVNAIKTE